MTTTLPPREERLYRFDGFAVDPVRRLLTRDGEPVVITPKALSVLLILLERPGQPVEKDELMRRIWPDTFVTEANLTQNVSALRKALGERAHEHRYVVTVPGRGYALVADVSEVVSGTARRDRTEAVRAPLREDVPKVETVAAPSPRGGLWSRRGMPVLILLLAGIAGIAAVNLGRLRVTDPAPSAAGPLTTVRPSIAVLGFKNLSRSSGSQWLGTALSEMLTTELGVGGRVRVVTGDTVARARQEPDLASLGPDSLRRLRDVLGCDLLVVGSYVTLGEGSEERVRLDLRVLRLPEGETVATLAQVGTEREVFELASQAGGRLRQILGWGDLSPEQVRKVEALRPSSPEAARLLAEGLERLRAYDSPRAVELLKQAAEADPGSAPIRAYLAQAWSLLGHDGKAVEEGRKAVELAAGLPRRERLAIEARCRAAGREWSEASELYRSLWTFHPDDIEYGLPLAASLYEAGRQNEALATLAALRRLPPPAGQDPRIDLQEAKCLRRLGDHAGTLRATEAAAAKGQRMGESLVVAQAFYIEATHFLMEGRLETAEQRFQEAQALYGEAGDAWGAARALLGVGQVLEKQGDSAGAERIAHEALGIAQELGNGFGMGMGLASLGTLHQSRGDLRGALRYMERSRARFAELEAPLLEARLLNASSVLLVARGDLEGARRRIEEVLAVSRRLGARADEARAFANLGMILSWQGELGEALRQQDAAIEVLRAKRDLENASTTLALSADVLSRLGDLAAARKRCDEALAMKKGMGDRLGTGQVLGSLALLEERAGDLAASRARSEEQLRLAGETGSRTLRAWALHGIGRVELAAGTLARARVSLESALVESSRTGDELRTMMIRVDLARLALAEEDFGRAERLADEAARWWRERRIPAGEARALAVQAEALRRLGRMDDARQTAGRMRSAARKSEDRDLGLAIAPELARIEAAAGAPERALAALHQAAAEARQRGFLGAEMEARLAAVEIDASKAGRALVETLRQEAESRGYGRVARRAETILKEVGRS